MEAWRAWRKAWRRNRKNIAINLFLHGSPCPPCLHRYKKMSLLVSAVTIVNTAQNKPD
jgi:hypothetical protein